MRKQLISFAHAIKFFFNTKLKGGVNLTPPLHTPLQCGQRLRWSALAEKIKTIVSDKVNYRGTQS